MTSVDPTRAAIEKDEAERAIVFGILHDDPLLLASASSLVVEQAGKIDLAIVYQAGQSGRVRGPWASTVQLLAVRALTAERKLAAMTSPGEGAPSPTTLPEAEPSPGDPSPTTNPTGAS